MWASPQPEPNPYQLEWDHLIDAIRHDKPYNEAKRGAEASLVQIMGRMAVHTGHVDHLGRGTQPRARIRARPGQADDGFAAPLLVGPDGKYPLPQPGINTQREY